jgi:hypothetical protein
VWEGEMTIYKKLQDGRMKLQEIKLEKTGFNKFSGYSYFQLGDFLHHIQKICAELGICGVISFKPDEATLRIIDVLEPSQEAVFTSPMSTAALKGCHDVQNLGAVQTYLRRYLWVLAFEIVEHDAIEESGEKKKTHSGTDGAFVSLEKEQRNHAEKAAVDIAVAFSKGEDWSGYDIYAKEDDADMRVAIWSFLNSKIRTAIKKMKKELDATAAAEEKAKEAQK